MTHVCFVCLSDSVIHSYWRGLLTLLGIVYLLYYMDYQLLDSPDSPWEYVSNRLDFNDLFQWNNQKIIVIVVSIIVLSLLRILTGRNLIAVIVVIVMVIYHIKRKREDINYPIVVSFYINFLYGQSQNYLFHLYDLLCVYVK